MNIKPAPDRSLEVEIQKWIKECEQLILDRLHTLGHTHIKEGDFHLELYQRIRNV